MKAEIHYGKAQVSTYRTYGTPLRGVAPIPESPFRERSNVLLAAEIDVQVLGDAFLAAYTEGDNSLVVATDTMKNFVHRESLAFTGATLEAWLWFLARRFLETYPHMEGIRVTGRELRFDAAIVPDEDGGFGPSEVLFSRSRDDHASAGVEVRRSEDGSPRLVDLWAARDAIQLMKVTGSSFAAFVRDEYTTLPERRDRPLYVWMRIGWRYGDALDAAEERADRYVPAEQVADLAATVFHRFVSLSIQHLIHEIGQTMLQRWDQLSEVSFEAQNRLWDLSHTDETDETIRVYTDPRPPYGNIGLTLRRE